MKLIQLILSVKRLFISHVKSEHTYFRQSQAVKVHKTKLVSSEWNLSHFLRNVSNFTSFVSPVFSTFLLLSLFGQKSHSLTSKCDSTSCPKFCNLHLYHIPQANLLRQELPGASNGASYLVSSPSTTHMGFFLSLSWVLFGSKRTQLIERSRPINVEKSPHGSWLWQPLQDHCYLHCIRSELLLHYDLLIWPFLTSVDVSVELQTFLSGSKQMWIG